MNLRIFDNNLIIELDWQEKLWSFNFSEKIEIPLNKIVSVTTDTPASEYFELRAHGAFIPGFIKAGTYYNQQGRSFWYVNKETDYLTLYSTEDQYDKKIVLTIDKNIDSLTIINMRKKMIIPAYFSLLYSGSTHNEVQPFRLRNLVSILHKVTI